MADELKPCPRPSRDELLRIAYRAAGRHSDIAKAVDAVLAAIDGTVAEPPAPAAIVIRGIKHSDSWSAHAFERAGDVEWEGK